jgi:hypothetical protein
MSDPIGTYTFLPWIRQGVVNRISGPPAGLRATIEVTLEIEGTNKGGGTTSVPVTRPVELYGPGDIVGVDAAMVSRVEPKHWVTNFEPNYLPAIEFYDEDFPWRYTPAAPADNRLLPWLALIVLEEGVEFREGNNVAGRPLPFVEVTADFADVFAEASERWAWAHAHFNAALSTEVLETDTVKAAQAAQNVISGAPDTACSRLLCPRKLKPKTGYHAFLMPAFESGRLAGLGRDPKPLFEDAANALHPTSPAWGAYGVPANRPDATAFPFYYRWYFRTAENGDFESLVRLLKRRAVDPRVGHRDMDVTDPAPNITGINDAALGGVLRLGGALKAPLSTMSAAQQAEFNKYDNWAAPYPHVFQSQLAAFLNLADSYQESGPAANADGKLDPAVNDDPDPMITPPIYGRWHALIERLLTERDGSDVPNRTNWVHDLNLDPRWRVAAGLGTEVIQRNQETYMEAAWRQIGDVLEANRRVRQAQLAKLAGRHLHATHVAGAEKVSAGTLLLLASPMKARVVSGGVTVRHLVRQSPLGPALVSSAMRRAIRPGGKLAKRLGLGGAQSAGALVAAVNAGVVTAAPPKVPPKGVLSPDDLADAVAPKGPLDGFWTALGGLIRRNMLLVLLVLLLLVVLLLVLGPLGIALAAAVVAVAAAVALRARRAADRQATADAVKEDNLTPATIDALPGASGFVLQPDFDPRSPPIALSVARGGNDSAEAARFKRALKDQYRLIAESRKLGEMPAMIPLDLARVAGDIVLGVRPDLTVPRWTLSGIAIPPRIREQIGETFVEAMAYPEFDTPMYEPLEKAGTELFVPNLHLIEPDSVTLLETNQKFIEAYMVGLNHEFARELLWREYPTDQRGSYFRQFWDVRKKIAATADKAVARERFKDIKPLHLWPQASDLGDHDNREEGSTPEEELVLVIRGELLKKYPNTVISAQPAKWQLKNGKPDKTRERVLDESVTPIAPLYEAPVAPDIYLFAFDLTAIKARGDDTVDDKPGWFFRLEEVPGDARFGFDITRDPGSEINVWNDLAWPDVAPGLADGAPIKVASIPARTLVEPVDPSLNEKKEQWEFDRQVPLDADVSSAELAYIALQTPVIMAIHASELLPNQGPA